MALEQERGALLIKTLGYWNQPGLLNTVRKAAQVQEIVEQAFAAGFSGIRFAVDMTWTLDGAVTSAAVEEWEAKADDLLRGIPVRAMCMYGRKRLTKSTVDAGLRTHRLILDGEGVQPNAAFRA